MDSKQIQTGILVLGMHRSGTSCITGMLQSAGMESGEVNEWRPDNKKGNRESKLVNEINENILRASGGSWKSPPSSIKLDKASFSQRDLVLNPLMEGSKPWLLKDPRITLTLPFWLDAIPNAHLLGVFRSPIDMASSLSVRDSIALADGLRLWQKYNSSLLKHYDTNEFPLIRFPDSPEALSTSLTKVLQDWYPNEISEKRLDPGRLSAFVDQQLIHHQSTTEDEMLNQISSLNLENNEIDQIYDTWNTLKRLSINKPEKHQPSHHPSLANSASIALQVDQVNSLNRNGKREEALEKLEDILQTQKDRSDLWLLGANILKKSGNSQKFTDWIERALRNVDSDPELKFHKAQDCWVNGDASTAIAIAEEISSQIPDWEDPQIQLGQWHYELKNWESSAKIFRALKQPQTGSTKQPEQAQFAQFYIDSGDGFSEAQSIKCPINLDNKAQSVELDLSKFSNIKKLRFDPLSESVIVRIESAQLISEDAETKTITLKPDNAYKTSGSTYYFTTIDPRFTILSVPQDTLNSSKIQIEFSIVKYANDALIELLKEVEVKPTTEEAPSPTQTPQSSNRQLFNETGALLGSYRFEGALPTEGLHKKVLIKGWVLPKDGRKINIALRYDGLTRSYPLNVSRPDVIKKHQVPDYISPQNTNLGFQYAVPKSSEIEIGIEHDMRLYWIETIHT